LMMIHPPRSPSGLHYTKRLGELPANKLCTSRLQQAIQHNKHVTPRPPLEVGQLALLNSADWRTSCQPGSDKLKERFKGPYTILCVFNHGQNVELDLPPNDQHHPTFHISKIKCFIHREEHRNASPGGLPQK
jgi:hypothetical protein